MLSNIREKLFKSFKSKKLNVFGLFLILSFLFLVVTKLSKTYTESIPFYITFSNVPEQHSITPNRDSILKVRVKAYGFNLLSTNFFKRTVNVDFNKEVKKYGKKYIWDSKKGLSKINSVLGSRFEVLSIQPDTLFFPYELMTVKTVPIKLNAQIMYASGYDIDSLTLQPDSVKVIGPKNVIEKITTIKTKELLLKDVNRPIDKEVALVLDKSLENVKLSSNKVKVLGNVQKFTEGTFEVPVSIINLPANIKINYFPKTVLVSYYVSLENYKNIKALDFKVICDYAEVQDFDKSFFTPKLVAKPKQVKSAKMKQNKVEFIILQ